MYAICSELGEEKRRRRRWKRQKASLYIMPGASAKQHKFLFLLFLFLLLNSPYRVNCEMGISMDSTSSTSSTMNNDGSADVSMEKQQDASFVQENTVDGVSGPGGVQSDVNQRQEDSSSENTKGVDKVVSKAVGSVSTDSSSDIPSSSGGTEAMSNEALSSDFASSGTEGSSMDTSPGGTSSALEEGGRGAGTRKTAEIGGAVEWGENDTVSTKVTKEESTTSSSSVGDLQTQPRMVPDKEEDEISELDTQSGNVIREKKEPVARVNFASVGAGATVLESSSGSKGYMNLLNEDKDKYGISPCSEKMWVVMSLSEDVMVNTIVLANYEKYRYNKQRIYVYFFLFDSFISALSDGVVCIVRLLETSK